LVTIKALDEITPEDLWREVKPEPDEFWRDFQEKQRRLVKTLLERALEEEMTVLLEAGRYWRTEARRGRRNGFYQRDLVTQYGIVTAIGPPRVRGVRLSAPFSACGHRQAQVDLLIRDISLAGVSPRRVGETLEPVGYAHERPDRLTRGQKPGPGGGTLPRSASGR
jgi:transposase-like protein